MHAWVRRLISHGICVPTPTLRVAAAAAQRKEAVELRQGDCLVLTEP